MKKTLSLLTSLILLATLALSCVPAFAEELNLPCTMARPWNR